MLAAAICMAACNNSKKTDVQQRSNTDTTATNPTENIISNQTPAMPDSATMAQAMKAWEDFAKPGAEHAWMATQTGTWVCDSIKQWMDPNQPPAISSATEKITMAINGLYQMTDFTGNMMGQPFTGHAMMGFDKMKKKFVLSWIDNMGSGIVHMEGLYNDATKTLNLSGTQSDPGQQKETALRQEIVFDTQASFIMRMYGTGFDGKEAKFMEGTFKRKK